MAWLKCPKWKRFQIYFYLLVGIANWYTLPFFTPLVINLLNFMTKGVVTPNFDFDLQIWYKFLQASWYNICFFNFNSYYFISPLFISNLDINCFNDSHNTFFANIDLLFWTSTLRWCLFFNLLIVDLDIPPMFNSLLIYMYIIMKLKK